MKDVGERHDVIFIDTGSYTGHIADQRAPSVVLDLSYELLSLVACGVVC